MPAVPLSGKQNRFLRGLGHHLNPVVLIGKDAVSQGVLDSVEEVLDQHELIKIKLLESCLVDRKDVAEHLRTNTGSAVVQILGRTILLFRATPENKIELPKK
ncbi:ribosome assembly RNA-binding protein YhbY [uncultured Desulfuromonas sp.]|uniref:ribosome assembly RNA-binding protein YhbY n=1 Tax=uncultured Desulfuromonas sp. TaxID=181013 RepID=UPI002AABD777|nr:ribosome assembly RNA-binding protein YhbY [uncultured Desulfuromonas sp.]